MRKNSRGVAAKRSSSPKSVARQHDPLVESLEPRQLLSASVDLAVDGTLTLRGNDNVANRFAVSVQSDGQRVVASVGGKVVGLNKSSIKAIKIEGSAARDDVWISTALTAPATINTYGGDDSVNGSGGADRIDAGSGNDTIGGQGGNDTLFGGIGNDTIRGSSGNDSILGSDGVDYIDGESGFDTVFGDADNDRIIGGDGNDLLRGGTGNDSLVGMNGNDSLFGESGFDTLSGGYGNDSLVGGADGDAVDGGPDTDVVYQDEAGSTPPPAPAPQPTPEPTPAPTPTGANTYDQWFTYTGNAGAGTPNVTLKLLGKIITAGGTVHVNATGTTLSAGTPLTARYTWDFGDAGSDYNTMRGWAAAHVYENAGEYNVKLTVTDELGRATTVSTKVTVKTDTRRTIYVSADGSDTNNGLSTSSPVRSVAKASSLLTDNTRVVFRRGDRFDVGDKFLDINDRNVFIGAYGTGNDPVLRKVSGGHMIVSVWVSARDTVIKGITFDSIYTPVNNSAPHIQANAVYAGGVNATVRDCTFLNIDTAVNGNRSPVGLMVQNNSAPLMSGLRGYLVWGQGSDHVYLGNTAVNSTREHIFRMNGVSRLNISFNDVRNANRQSVDGGDYSKGSIEVHKGSWAYVARNKVTDGPLRVGPRGGTVDPVDAIHEWSVFEGNESRDVSIQIRPGAHNVMLRNNVIWQDDSEDSIKIYANDAQGRQVRDVWILNNTGYNIHKHGRFLGVERGPSGITVANNLYVMPKMETGGDRTASVTVYADTLSSFRSIARNVWQTPTYIMTWAQGGMNYVGKEWTSSGYRTAGEWDSFSQVQGDVFAKVTLNGWTPGSTSAAAGAGTKVAGVWDDFYGNSRSGSSVTAGAVQV